MSIQSILEVSVIWCPFVLNLLNIEKKNSEQYQKSKYLKENKEIRKLNIFAIKDQI
jgi:hypothetical protein